MDGFEHPSVSIVNLKLKVEKNKRRIKNRHPEWTELGVMRVATWEHYFSQWATRFLRSIPYTLLTSIGALTLFKDLVWFEPLLATILTKWSDIAQYIFKFVTLGIFAWLEIAVPDWLISYLTIGVGMVGIMAKMLVDIQIIEKASICDDAMGHLSLTSGFAAFGSWVIFCPFLAPFWPVFILVPIFTMFSLSLAEKWEIPKNQVAAIQLKRSFMYTEPFVIASLIWAIFWLFWRLS